MKRTIRLFSLMVGVLAAGTSLSLAQGDEEKKTERGPRAERPARGERAQRGPRRELTEEQKAQMEKRRAAMTEARKNADANGNEKIDEGAEQEAYTAAIKNILFGGDDGVINTPEEEEAAKKFRGRGARGPRGEGRAPGARRGPAGDGEGRPRRGRPGATKGGDDKE